MLNMYSIKNQIKRYVFDAFGLGADRTESVELAVEFTLGKDDFKPTKFLHGLKINVPGILPYFNVGLSEISIYCKRYPDVELTYKHISKAENLKVVFEQMKQKCPNVHMCKDEPLDDPKDMDDVLWVLNNPQGRHYFTKIGDFDLQVGEGGLLTSEDVTLYPSEYTNRYWKDLNNKTNLFPIRRDAFDGSITYFPMMCRVLNCYTIVHGRLFKLSLKKSNKTLGFRGPKLRKCVNMNWLENEARHFKMLNGCWNKSLRPKSYPENG